MLEHNHPKKTIMTITRTVFFIKNGTYITLKNLYNTPSVFCTPSVFLPRIQQKISKRFSACRMASSVIKLTKQVICNRKSMRRAMPAYNANALTAGISDSPPKKKQKLSLTDVNSIDGPTIPKMRPTCSAC